jgi:hypothetical protein
MSDLNAFLFALKIKLILSLDKNETFVKLSERKKISNILVKFFS